MYVRLSHKLKDNKAKRAPKNVIFFDTETNEKETDENTKELTLRLGYAILTERADSSGYAVQEACEFYTTGQFCDWIQSVCKGKKRYYVVAHNIGFDLRITGLTKFLTKSGWKRSLLIMEGTNFMVRYKKGDTAIFLMNNMQLFNSSLASLGESIGIAKLDVDFATVENPELMTYCKRDVEVMRVAWNVWYRFVQDNDLGNFQHTIGSQAMSAYRHRFMEYDITVHTDDRATLLERDSYHGGRVECFRLGEQPREPYYVLDINSMYPFVMKNYPVPTKLLRYYEKIPAKYFEEIRTEYGYIVEAHVRLEKPLLPATHNGRLVFPVGEIHGVFTKPELELALEQGTLLGVSRCALYNEETAFSSFVSFFYAARKKFKADGNEQFAYFSKLILNSLYGKFGQKITEYKAIGYNAALPDESGTTYLPAIGQEVKYRRLDGITEIETGEREAYNSFPAVASYITAAARAYLTTIIDKAGWSNVLYCDTDSVFVNQKGYDRLVDEIDPDILGKLKLEGKSDSVAIFGPKRYRFGDKERSKGIRRDARKVGEDLYSQEQFESFVGALRSGFTDRVRIHTITKKLSQHYTKGVASEDGTVRPFRFPQELGESEEAEPRA